MAKRTSSRSEANDNNEATRPRTSRSRGERGTALPNAAPIARSDETPNVPEPGDAADRAAQSEPGTTGVPTPSESLGASLTGHAHLDEDLTNRSESMSSEPSEDDIRLRAYHRYLERGGGHGAHFDDWLEAERELKEKREPERKR